MIYLVELKIYDRWRVTTFAQSTTFKVQHGFSEFTKNARKTYYIVITKTLHNSICEIILNQIF